MSLLELNNIFVKLEKYQALHELSLRLEAGQRLVLMGPSGAGKTTLLRVMARLQQPSSGKLLLNGVLANTQTSNPIRIALLSQDYALYPQLTVGQNLAVALKQEGLSSPEISCRIEQVSSWFDIEALRSRFPSQISGGQAQRVAFAKALARRPQLLLLDEPLSQVDISLRNQLLETLLFACEQLQTAVCWVTHDPQEAFRVATQIAVLEDGRLVQHATAWEIYQSPKSRTVADLTSMWPINWLPLDQPEFASLRQGASYKHVGVRSEHMTLASESDLRFDFRIECARFLGFARLLQGFIGKTPIQMLDSQQQYKIGDTIRVSIDPERILRFSQS